MSTDLDRAKAHIPEPSIYSYSARDAIIYALGIGATVQDSLHFLYENHADFQVFPTFFVAPGLLANTLTDWPGLQFDLTRILHGEHSIELFAALPSDGAELRSEMRLLDVLDKGSGILMITEVSTFDSANGQLLAKQRFGIFQTGKIHLTGLSRTSPVEEKAPAVPKDRLPDIVITERIGLDQAALYRLGSGDLNPLHVDSDFAKISGFPQPILHGLCSLGVASRLVLQDLGENNAENLSSVRARFTSPVLPGQSLAIECWLDPARVGGIHFQAKILETGRLALSNGYLLLRNHPTNQSSSLTKKTVKSRAIFETLGRELSRHGAPDNSSAEDSERTVIVFDVNRQRRHIAFFSMEFKTPVGGVATVTKVYEGYPAIADSTDASVTTVGIDDDQFVRLVEKCLRERAKSAEENPRHDSDETPSEVGAAAAGSWLESFSNVVRRIFGRLDSLLPFDKDDDDDK